MRPIRPGDRGPAVEDIQRRLRSLGYDLGPTGVDGVFLGMTAQAVRSFQSAMALSEDALVGDETWSALVDQTFTLGDRMLYLRLPHFHGRDVRVLQEALSILGFACGAIDGILGAYTERAICEFQRNTGLPADGIVGDETVRALVALKHVWEGKDPRAHSAATVGVTRECSTLLRHALVLRGLDPGGEEVAQRVLNLALATNPEARVSVVDSELATCENVRLVLEIGACGTLPAVSGRPVVRLLEDGTFFVRLMTAVESSRNGVSVVAIELAEGDVRDERESQRAAGRLLDAVCGLFD